jgi:uncharacterized membrane protein (GlpM family)
MRIQNNKKYQVLGKISTIDELKEKIAVLPDTVKLKLFYSERRYDGGIEIGIVLEDSLTENFKAKNEVRSTTRQYFVWGVFFLVSSILLLPVYLAGLDKEDLFNGNIQAILCTCMMGLFVLITFLCFSVGIYRKIKVRKLIKKAFYDSTGNN